MFPKDFIFCWTAYFHVIQNRKRCKCCNCYNRMPLLPLELFQYAKDLTLDFADVIFKRRAFNKCVSGLIYECKLTSCGDLTNSKYLTNLFEVLHHSAGTIEGFQKRIEEVSKHAKESYVRRRLWGFWATIEKKTSEHLNDENLATWLEKLFKTRCGQHTGSNTGELLNAYIFGTINSILEQLSSHLSTKTVHRETFADACKAISNELAYSNRQLSELIEVFNPRISKLGNPAETIRKCLTWENVSNSSAPASLTIFELAADFIDELKANEPDKKEEISLFFEEVKDYLFEKDGERKSSILLFEEQFYEINEKLTLLATFYFQQSNTRQFPKFGKIWSTCRTC